MTAIAHTPRRSVRTLLDRPVLRAFVSAPTGVFGLAAILLLAIVAIVGPPIWGDEARAIDTTAANQGPSWSEPLGTDQLGRDVLARLLVGTRQSLALSLAATAVALIVGVAFGASTALLRNRARVVSLRLLDALLSFPKLLTAIFASVVVGGGGAGATVGVAIAVSFQFARVSSTLAFSARSRDFVSAGRVIGVQRGRLLGRYILPNISEPLIVTTSVAIGTSIVTVSALSFLGLGVQPPAWDWGSMLTEGVQNISLTPAAALGPAAAIAFAGLAFGFAGEALARAMNPLVWTVSKRRGTVTLTPAATVAPATAPTGAAEIAPTNGDGALTSPPAQELLPPADGAVLSVRELVVSFPTASGSVEIVKGISFDLAPGEIVGIVGESGSGKTMTALAVSQLVAYPGRVDGRIMLHGRDVTELPRRELAQLLGGELAMVFQDPMSSFTPGMKVGTQLTEGIRRQRGLTRRQAKATALAALEEVRIPAAAEQLVRYPYELSGGMRQRAMLAMGLMRTPSVLIADEPTTALDVTIQAQIMALIQELNERHDTAVLLISHDLALVSQDCDRVLVMYAGRLVEDVSVEQLRTNPLHPYTRALLNAVPRIDTGRDELLESIPGEVPEVGSPPSGCPYHPRCPLAVAACAEQRPALRTFSAGRRVACHLAEDEGV